MKNIYKKDSIISARPQVSGVRLLTGNVFQGKIIKEGTKLMKNTFNNLQDIKSELSIPLTPPLGGWTKDYRL